MSSNIIPFNYSGTQVRVVEMDGEPWFVASDVAKVLGYARPENAVASHCKNRRRIDLGYSSKQGGTPYVTMIPERDVYRLIMRSKLPEAERFEEWVVGEVLPQVRKTGSYTTQVPQTYAEALQLAANQARELEETRPKARSYDAIADTEGTFALSDIGKKLGWGPNKFIEQLRADGVLFYRRQGSKHVNIPYQEHIDAGRFTVRTIQIDPLRQQTRVTGKGELWLAQHYTLGHSEGVG
jgi:prophage antirepressor-like protein